MWQPCDRLRALASCSVSFFWRTLTYPLLTRAPAISTVERQRIELGAAIWTAELRERGDDAYDLAVSVDRQSVGPVISWREDAAGERTDTLVDGAPATETFAWGPEELQPDVSLALQLSSTSLSATVRMGGSTARVVCRQVKPQSWMLEPWQRDKGHGADSPSES
jgi:hypothetical protein